MGNNICQPLLASSPTAFRIHDIPLNIPFTCIVYLYLEHKISLGKFLETNGKLLLQKLFWEMKNHYFLFLLIPLFYYCNPGNLEITQKQIDSDGEIMEGPFLKGIGFNGLVQYYNSGKVNVGNCYFRNGLENGYMVRYKNGYTTDSINFRNGLKHSFSFKMDSLGRILYKVYYSWGKRLGDVYLFDSFGNVNKYFFTNFQGETIYSYDVTSSTLKETGSNFAYYISNDTIKGEVVQRVLLYLISPPHFKCHYELGIINKEKKIISSTKIPNDDCYFEKELEKLSNGFSFALVLHTYNEHKKRDDLMISILE